MHGHAGESDWIDYHMPLRVVKGFLFQRTMMTQCNTSKQSRKICLSLQNSVPFLNDESRITFLIIPFVKSINILF